MRKISAAGPDSNSSSHEEFSILLDQGLSDRHPDVVIRMDGNDSATDDVNSSGYEVWQEDQDRQHSSCNRNKINNYNKNVKGESFEGMSQRGEDPSRLIGQFLNKQKTQDEIALDMDLEMEGLEQMNNINQDQARDLRVSFGPNTVDRESVRRRYKDSPEGDPNTISQKEQQGYYNYSPGELRKEEVLRCTANASFNKRNISFQKNPSLLVKIKTRSRLQDPPQEEIELISQRSGQLKSGMLQKIGPDDDEDPLWSEDLPEEYTKANLSAITLLQWVSLFIIVALLICSLSIPYLKKKTVWNLELWKWELMVLVLICGRLLSGWGIRIVVFFIERNFFLRKRLLYFVYGVRKPVQNCLWLGLVLIAWDRLFDRKVERETESQFLEFITKILVCLLIGTLFWLVKTLMVKVLASSFHVSTYFDRIQESLFNQYVIETLSGPPLIGIQRVEEDVERTAAEVHKLQNAGAVLPPDLRDDALGKSGRVIGRSSRHTKSGKLSGALSKKSVADVGITIYHLHKLNHKNISAWNMKRHIYLEDLMRFMQEEGALKTMSLFEGAAENKRISKSSLKHWVVNSFRERRALALTLNDAKTAVNKLHRVVNIIVGAIILVIWLVILQIATSKFLLFVSSQLVLVAFVFGNTCKTVFEALVFLFIIHPFDVGDRCEVDGVQMIVEEMNILTTVFLRHDNLKIVYPNSTLSQKPINNFYRSPDMVEVIDFCIHITTPMEKIAMMKQRIMSYVDGKKEHWCSSPTIILKDVVELNSLSMQVWLTHKMNHQNITEKWTRRSLFMEELVQMFKELDMQYRLYPLDINIHSAPAMITSERMPSTWTSATSPTSAPY
ncbi:hypothetical protein Patl1_35863 [Pistacia atlantica]|nr:hypothetical protein Patl1_35863 [Pistacia atlantica]